MAGWSENTSTTTARIAATTTARLTINPDTTDEIVLAGPDDGGGGEGHDLSRPEPGRRRFRWWFVPLILLGVAAIAGLFIRLPYDTIAPGSSRQVNDVVLIKGGPSFPPKGQIMETTVSVRERVTPYEVLYGWLNPDVDVIAEKQIRGNTPPKVYEQQNVEAMADSKKVAEAVALQHLGYNIVQGNGAVLNDVRAGTPAAAAGLKPGDVVVAVDGRPVKIETQAVDAIHAHKPGDVVALSIVRGTAAPQTVNATLTSQNGQAFLGVTLETSGLQFKPPFDINIDSGSVVGPSAGAAYGLELLDQLTPGELTGGGKVAVTGQLFLDGKIGEIGGVAQKAVTVRRSGASIFIVPRANYKEAKAHAGSNLKVYPVDNFDDALRILGTLKGSDALQYAPQAPKG